MLNIKHKRYSLEFKALTILIKHLHIGAACFVATYCLVPPLVRRSFMLCPLEQLLKVVGHAEDCTHVHMSYVNRRECGNRAQSFSVLSTAWKCITVFTRASHWIPSSSKMIQSTIFHLTFNVHNDGVLLGFDVVDRSAPFRRNLLSPSSGLKTPDRQHDKIRDYVPQQKEHKASRSWSNLIKYSKDSKHFILP
jgi:hypothetical protein